MSFRTYQGNAYTENGWRICNADEITRINVAGMTLPVRGGYAAVALGAWVRWYHENVDRIDEYKPTDDWGFSWDNAVSNSNHLSGTAVDLNATEYPWGGNTMARNYPGRVAAIRRGLELFEGIIFWGGDWDRRDEMHFQLNDGTAQGDGASQRLIDFCNRRIVDGALVGSSSSNPGEVNGFTRGFMAPIGSDAKDVREQLCGRGSRDAGSYKGWPQLGGRTVADAIAAIVDHA